MVVLAQQHEHLTLHALMDAAPTWLAADQPRCGAPGCFWVRFTATLSPETLDGLLARPDRLAEVLVEAWRRWRVTWIVGEWQV